MLHAELPGTPDSTQTFRLPKSPDYDCEQRYQSLTVREHEVMTLVVSGMLNKQIASELGASEATVKIHRGHVMEKMQAGSIVELVRMADKLKLSPRR